MCKGCKQTKASNDFYRNRTNADGLFGKCKLCSDKQADANRRPRVRHNVTEPTVESKVRAQGCRQGRVKSTSERATQSPLSVFTTGRDELTDRQCGGVGW